MSDEVQGRQEHPFTHAPDDWHTNGVPYGAFCLCHKCGYVGTSTVAFDYRAETNQEILCVAMLAKAFLLTPQSRRCAL